MSRNLRDYLGDILEATKSIEHFAEGVEFENFDADRLRFQGVLFNFMIIGEAVKNIPDEIRDQMPTVNWRDIGRFRDLIVHHYYKINREILWNTIKVHLPELHIQIEKFLQTLDENPSERPQES